jgi:hypothetical protein
LSGTGAPLERFKRAIDLAERTDAPLHVARTLAAMSAHLRRSDPRSAEVDMESLFERPVDVVSRRSLDADRDRAVLDEAIDL